MAFIRVRSLARRTLVLTLAAASFLPLASCGKECDSCEKDEDCAAEGLVCVKFSNGSRRCGSGVGATTCRVP